MPPKKKAPIMAARGCAWQKQAAYFIQGTLILGSTKRCQIKSVTSHSIGVGWFFVWVLGMGFNILQVVGAI